MKRTQIFNDEIPILMDAFRALVIHKEDDHMVTEIRDIEAEDLPEGDVLVDVRYASLNYKDGPRTQRIRGPGQDVSTRARN